MIRHLTLFTVIALLLTGLSACSPTVANRGNIVDAEELAAIKVGGSTREDVMRILGSPTQIGTFDENTWYYFGRSTKQYSFLDPDVTNSQAVEITFDDTGTVTALNKFDPKDAQNISPVARRTPTYGHETTILEQLIGNLGRPTASGAIGSKK